MSSRINSFIAANAVPAKIFGDPDLVNSIISGKIPPYHVQINPTNACPLNCLFCSCRNRDKSLEIPYEKLKEITGFFIEQGSKAFTITGGGDPLMYEPLADYIKLLSAFGIEVGLVTDGLRFGEFDKSVLEKLTWCRISVSDERKLHQEEIYDAVQHKTDWAFSYVVTDEPDIGNLIECIRFANKHGFSHVRVVDDILGKSSTSNAEKMRILFEQIEGLDLSRVIWQNRKKYTKGQRCYISLLKPNIGPDGNWYPCCGLQYASFPPMLDFARAFSMGSTAKDFSRIVERQQAFDGTICERCYYSDYNRVLEAMITAKGLEHKKHI